MSDFFNLKINRILLLFITFWIIIAVFRTFYNSSKLYTEEKSWYGLTYEEKRGKQFGDTHYFLRFLDSHTEKNSNILLFTNDLRVHYLSRYYIYPEKKIIAEHDDFQWYPEKDIYDYIVIFPFSSRLLDQAINTSRISKFKKIATFEGDSGQVGFIYKK